MTALLKVGDTVSWRGSWGSDAPKLAKVVGLAVTDRPREKHGFSVELVHWSVVETNHCIVDLDNGHWAYGFQVSQPTPEVTS